VSRKGKGEEF